MAKYGVSHTSALESVWADAEAVNSLDEFVIEYPSLEEYQLKIAQESQNVSKVQFSSCASTIDGILIWILKPSEVEG